MSVGNALQKKWNALHAFAGSNQINHVDMLLRHGVVVNARDMVSLPEYTRCYYSYNQL